MNGLLLKNFLVIRKQLKLFLIIIPIITIFGGVSMASIAILMGEMLTIIILNVVSIFISLSIKQY